MESHVSSEPLVFDMEVRDLSPQKDPKGGSPKSGSTKVPQPEQPEKPKSDQLRHASFGDYMKAHSHPNGDTTQRGWHGFIKSNLFVALVIFFLGQGVVVGTSYFLNYVRTSKLWEWKVTTDLTLKRMDDWGTIHGHYADERQDTAIIELQSSTKTQTQTNQQMNQLITLTAERNNQQDKDISDLKAQMSQMVVLAQEIKTKLTVVADLMDERTKNKR